MRTGPGSARGGALPALASNAAVARALQGPATSPALAVHDDVARVRRAALSTMPVSRPDDPAEREAEAFASRIVHLRAPQPAVVPADGAGRVPAGGPPAGRARRAGPTASREPDGAAAGGGAGGAAAAQVAAGGDVPVSQATQALVANPGGGVPLDPAVRAKIEPHLGVDLSDVRVHSGPDAAAAAAELQARAFTVGGDIFLGEGQSPGDLELMAHEATHVVQQRPVDTWRVPAQRDFEAGDLVPDFVIDGVKSALRAIPGYSMLGLITGKDPLTDEPVRTPDVELVETLLTFGPFGAAVGPVIEIIKVLGDVIAYLRERMGAHGLTLERVGRDIGAAWDELDFWAGIDDNVAIVERYIDAFLADVRAFIGDVKDAVIAKVREVAASVAEPLLQTDAIAPIWNLAVEVFHYNPLTGQPVNVPPEKILADFLILIHQGDVVAQMEERGTLKETANWLADQWDRFTGLLERTGALFARAWDAISPSNLPNLLDNLESLADEAWGLIQDVGAFAWTVIDQVLVFVKKSLLGWLSEHAHKLPGFHLLTVIIEKNPFTDEPVPRNAVNLIRGFITLLPGGDAMYDKLAESGAIAEAGARIDGAVESLGISWELIVATFKGVWDTVKLESLLSPVATFDEIVAKFGEPLGRIFEFISIVVQTIIELILRMMGFPPELVGNVVSNAIAAIDDIVADPVGFLINLIAAMKAGFTSFFGSIGKYLLDGLVDWLFRGLQKIGVERPSELSLESAITLIVQVSGITMEIIWQKLAVHLGQETVDKIRRAIELAGEAFAFVKEVQEEGFSAIWRRLTEKLSSLWDALFGMVRDWLMKEVVDAAIQKVLSMLDPTGIMAVINGAIAFFKAVQSVLDYVRELLEIVDSYVSTIGAIAKGDVGPGAKMLESGLAQAVPVAIGFLANQVGLGDAPERIAEFVISLREKLLEALDWLIEKAVSLGQSALAVITGAGGAEEGADGRAPTAEDMELLVVDETVKVQGEDHHVKDDGADHELVLHSPGPGTPVDELPTPAEVLTAAVKAQVAARQKYFKVRAAWEKWAALNKPDAPMPPDNMATVKADLKKAIKAVIDALEDARPPGFPGMSAPGIGETDKHGAQPPRIRTASNATLKVDDPVWATESEHVLPFASGATLWTVLGLGKLVRKKARRVDHAQTTIVIYYDAARIKTPQDNALLTALEADAESKKAAVYAGANGLWGKLEDDDVDAKELYRQRAYIEGVFDTVVWDALRAGVTAAVGRTMEAVEGEHAKVDSSRNFTATNGARRAEAAPLPAMQDVAKAAVEQANDLRAMLREAVTAQLGERLELEDML